MSSKKGQLLDRAAGEGDYGPNTNNNKCLCSNRKSKERNVFKVALANLLATKKWRQRLFKSRHFEVATLKSPSGRQVIFLMYFAPFFEGVEFFMDILPLLAHSIVSLYSQMGHLATC